MSDLNSTSYIFGGLPQDDNAEVEALLASQRKFTEKYAPIRRYSFDPPSTLTGALQPALVSGTDTPSYRVESLSDPAPDEDKRELVMALTGDTDNFHSQGGVGLGSPGVSPSSYQKGDEELNAAEVIIDANGQPRHAGATTPEGEYIKRFKKRAEESLFLLAKGGVGGLFSTSHIHN